MRKSTALALLPLIAAILMLTAKFYIREGAISVFSVELHARDVRGRDADRIHGAASARSTAAYAWVGFGGVGALLFLGGLISFYR